MQRIAAFTHDTYGLGHGRRCLNIMRAVSEKAANSAILIVTACPALNLMSALPRNADVVKIPTLARTGDVHPEDYREEPMFHSTKRGLAAFVAVTGDLPHEDKLI